MLDPEPPVARAVLARHPLEDVELQADRAVADRVHHHLQPGVVGALRPRVQVLGRVDEQPRSCGASLNGSSIAAVCEPSEPSTNPLSPPMRSHASPRPRAATVSRSRSHVASGTTRVDPRAQPSGAVRALEDGEIVPGPHVVHGRHALLGDVAHRGVEARPRRPSRAAAAPRASTSAIALSLRIPVGSPRRVAHDRAAVHVARCARRPPRRAAPRRWRAPCGRRGGRSRPDCRASPSRSTARAAARRPTLCGPSRRR